KLSDPALRSAVCLGLGNIPAERLAPAEMEALRTVVSEWYQTSPDNVTHSTADWALRQWKVDLPALATSSQPSESRDWFVNSLGMTMLKIRPGQFVRRDNSGGNDVRDAKDQTVTLTRAFYLCDREVTISQFRRFLEDTECPLEEKPTNWQQIKGG